MNNGTKLFFIIVLSFTAGFIVSYITLMQEIHNENINLKQTAEMWSFTSGNEKIRQGNVTVSGIASNGIIYIYAKDKNIDDVLNICAHEWAHAHEGMKDG